MAAAQSRGARFIRRHRPQKPSARERGCKLRRESPAAATAQRHGADCAQWHVESQRTRWNAHAPMVGSFSKREPPDPVPGDAFVLLLGGGCAPTATRTRHNNPIETSNERPAVACGRRSRHRGARAPRVQKRPRRHQTRGCARSPTGACGDGVGGTGSCASCMMEPQEHAVV
jgi:hypothetical protein